MRNRSNRGGWVPAPAANLVVPGRELSGPDDWDRQFGRAAPLVVEIGFGKDTFLLERAEQFPSHNHVGVERDPHRVATFLRRAAKRGLQNVRALPVAAELALADCFADEAASELHVYFPDPWPKGRHERNRLVRPWFAREADRVLAVSGALFVSTDDVAYREQIVAVLTSGSRAFELVGSSDRPRTDHETSFERLWRREGRDICHMEFRRPATRATRSPIPKAGETR